MNRYLLIHRLRGPAFLLLVGVIALLAQTHILGWAESWPLFLILAGVLLLAERAALSSEGYPFFGRDAGARPNNPGAGHGAGTGAPQSAGVTGTAIVPSNHPHDFGKD